MYATSLGMTVVTISVIPFKIALEQFWLLKHSTDNIMVLMGIINLSGSKNIFNTAFEKRGNMSFSAPGK